MVLADDYQPIVARIRGILREEFEVIGTAENGNEAVELVLTRIPTYSLRIFARRS